MDWDQNLFEPITDAVESTGVVHTTRLAYSFTVTNSGDGAATSVMLTDFLPAGVHIVDNPDGGNVIDNTVTWDLGDIGADEQKIVTLIVETDRGRAIGTLGPCPGWGHPRPGHCSQQQASMIDS